MLKVNRASSEDFCIFRSLNENLIVSMHKKSIELKKDVSNKDQAHWTEIKKMIVSIKRKKAEVKKLNRNVQKLNGLEVPCSQSVLAPKSQGPKVPGSQSPKVQKFPWSLSPKNSRSQCAMVTNSHGPNFPWSQSHIFLKSYIPKFPICPKVPMSQCPMVPNIHGIKVPRS